MLEIPEKHVKGKPDWLVTPNFVVVCEETSSNPHSSDKIKHHLTFGRCLPLFFHFKKIKAFSSSDLPGQVIPPSAS